MNPSLLYDGNKEKQVQIVVLVKCSILIYTNTYYLIKVENKHKAKI